MRAVPEAEAKIRTLIHQLQANTSAAEAQRWVELIRSAFVHPQLSGGMKKWCIEHHNQSIDTLQATYDEGGILRKLWAPGVRTMRSDPYGVKFYADDDEPASTRRFPGNLTMATTDEVYVGYNHDFLQVFVYHVVDEARKV